MQVLLNKFNNNVDELVNFVLPRITHETDYFICWHNNKGKSYINFLRTVVVQQDVDYIYDELLLTNDYLEGCKNISNTDIICSTIISAVSKVFLIFQNV